MMKKIMLFCAVWFAALSITAQVTAEDMTVGQSCTSIMVGKNASATGEVIQRTLVMATIVHG